MQVESTLYSADRKAQVTLPSHFWSKHSIERVFSLDQRPRALRRSRGRRSRPRPARPRPCATTKDPMPVGVFTARLA